ncbi:MAG: hypothetical protein PQJ58_00475 [Spirochaetales bacterium]|nr:hypothetical protein [Spirochaetales bacterium]
MKKSLIIVLLVILVSAVNLSAQSSVKGMNAGGITGIAVAPSARIGWEKSDFGLDFSYTMLYRNEASHIPAATISLFEKAEIGFAFDMEGNDWNNMLLGAKYQLSKEGNTALALGGNFEYQTNDLVEDNSVSSDVYVVATYSGEFFNLPALTSMLLGWQFWEAGDFSTNLKYSMGFEMGFFPDTFNNYIYWISDFSNYSYATYSFRMGTDRGIFNTGLRIDPVKNNKYKLVFNILGTDLLDDGSRGLMVNATFGMGF